MSDFTATYECYVHGSFSIDDSPGGCPTCPENALFFPWDIEIGDKIVWHDPEGSERLLNVCYIDYEGVLGNPDCIISIYTETGEIIKAYERDLQEL